MELEDKLPILLVLPHRCAKNDGILEGVSTYNCQSGRSSAILDRQDPSDEQCFLLSGRRWRGVISDSITDSLMRFCQDHSIPLVDVGEGQGFANVSRIRPKNYLVGQLGAAYFLNCGFLDFAFIGFSDQSWARKRREGFAEALARMGKRTRFIEYSSTSQHLLELTVEQIADLEKSITSLPRCTAVMACNDRIARQVILAAKKIGILVPEQLAVLGVGNDLDGYRSVKPALSSVALNYRQAGFLAGMVVEKLWGCCGGVGRLDIEVDPVDVIIRHSTNSRVTDDVELLDAIDFVRANACRGLTVAEIVSRGAVSRDRLERGFRRLVGYSPHAEIRRVQLARIEELLAQTDLPLKMIAPLTGIPHTEYLSVLFRRLTGETPGQFRERARFKTESLGAPRWRCGVAASSNTPEDSDLATVNLETEIMTCCL
ncbi:xylose operon regulatory protein [mine drainage metagenome]|uniref:Xylose operon regulatory protein n=1 Tax=mine drainage metagenome TaxID=410659 RepID=A0A1J5T2N8_9ZZZZ